MNPVTFSSVPKALPASPNRMDVAAFFGFIPLRPEQPSTALQSLVRRSGWSARLEEFDDLRNVPIRVSSIAEFEATFESYGRLDRIATVLTRGLKAVVTLDGDEKVVGLSLDGVVHRIELAAGDYTHSEIVAALAEQIPVGLSVILNNSDPINPRIEFKQSDSNKPVELTIFANEALGIPDAIASSSRLIRCPMAVSVHSFFECGGSTCYIIRVGDPLPVVSSENDRVQHLGLLANGQKSHWPEVKTFGDLDGFQIPPPVAASSAQSQWRGLGVLHGLPDVTFVLLPDLPDLVASRSALQIIPDQLQEDPTLNFTPCVEPAGMTETGEFNYFDAPSSNQEGMRFWGSFARWYVTSLRGISAELVGCLALPRLDEQSGLTLQSVLETDVFSSSMNELTQASRLQIVHPFVRSGSGHALEPGDGHLVGTLAKSALGRGAYATIAGQAAKRVEQVEQFSAPLSPQTGAGRRITLIGETSSGMTFLNDVTVSFETAWRQAPVVRLMCLLFRAARLRGEKSVFEPSAEKLWVEIQYELTLVLRRVFLNGGLGGSTEAEAFSVSCDRSTMSQADIDAGRLIAIVSVLPVASIETIEVALNMTSPLPTLQSGRVA